MVINRLREFRVKADKSQIELSRITGVAQATISNIESCNRTPSYLTRQRLANALGYPVEEIFPNEEDLGNKKKRRKVRSDESSIADILLVNSTSNLSPRLQTKDAPKSQAKADLIEDDKVIGFIFNTSGEKLKFYPIRIFKGKEFVDVACTDATGKFVFSELKAGKYTLTTEGKTLEFRVKS
ncbi:helix-turn-helix domain-containing protein [bacterium]|nr:helix-turn-helix domain-containing protein [bacterium]